MKTQKTPILPLIPTNIDGDLSRCLQSFRDVLQDMSINVRSDLDSLSGGGDSGTGDGVIEQPISRQATFTKASNQIECSNIIPDLGLELGDVIQISDATNAANNKLFTVEDITGTDFIVVNFEHRNGAGPLSLANETNTVSIKRIAKWYNAPLGLGQAWVGRGGNSSWYRNTTNRHIQIAVMYYANGEAGNFQIRNEITGGVVLSHLTNSSYATACFNHIIMPDESWYVTHGTYFYERR